MHGDDSILDNGDVTGSTPRAPATQTKFSHIESPYESLKQEMKGEEAGHRSGGEDDEDSTMFLQHATARLPDMSMTPRSSLFPEAQPSTQRAKDPILHRVLDKTYRLQATPHKFASPAKGGNTTAAGATWMADSPMSSPVIAVPKLRSEAFLSPIKTDVRARLTAAMEQTRTPGKSVQTPATMRRTRDVFGGGDGGNPDNSAIGGGHKAKDEITWESDSDDDDAGFLTGRSPPKTIQFALPPSKAMQTPGMFFFRPNPV